MLRKLRIHLWTLPRWFALPFFGSAILLGAVVAGGNLASWNTWLAFATGVLLMAGGHSFNTLLDTTWTKLDASPDSHSVEKDYSGGSTVISGRLATEVAVLLNGVGWYLLALVPAAFLVYRTNTVWIWLPVAYGMLVTFLYSKSKFTLLHETVLATGPVAGAIMGALSTGTGHWLVSALVTVPNVLIFSFAGLALDEYPDAAQNLKKGVKSLAFKVYERGYDLSLYVMLWLVSAFLLQFFLITVGILKPLTGLTLVVLPLFIGASVFLKPRMPYFSNAAIWEKHLSQEEAAKVLEKTEKDDAKTFKRAALFLVVVGMIYPVLILVGQVLG